MSGQIPMDVRKKALERAFPPPDPYINDPHGWVKDRINGFLWSKQVEIAESVRDNRYTAVYACHGPGKSYDASAIATWWIDVHPPREAMVVTTAPTDHQVKAILWKEIARRHREARMPGRVTLEAKWYIGNRMVDEELCGFGRKPQDYDEDAFQGIHEKYVLILVDEACGVPKNLFDALETLMTNEYARMLAIGNPDDSTAYFANICQPASGWNSIQIPVWSTPAYTGERVPEHVREKLVSKMWVEERKTKWGVGSPLWQAKVEAEFPNVTFDTLITPHSAKAAQERMLEPVGLGELGIDVARFGPDETVIMHNRGGVVKRVHSAHKQDTVKTADMITLHLLTPTQSPKAVVDVVGVGGGVVDTLKRRGLNVVPFNGGVPAYDNQRFANRRAECYWQLRHMFETGKVDIDPFDEELYNQLTSIKWKLTRQGQVLIESKEDMKKRGLPSPDRADAMMMACTALANLSIGPQIMPIPTITGDLMEMTM